MLRTLHVLVAHVGRGESILKHAVHAVGQVLLNIAITETEAHLVNVTLKVLRADEVPGAEDGTLGAGPDALDAVSRHIAASELLASVVDNLALEVIKAIIDGSLIGENGAALLHPAAEQLVNRGAVGVRHHESVGLTAAAGAEADDGGLADGAAPLLELLLLVLVHLLAADVSLIDLNDTLKKLLVGLDLASLTNALKEEPGAFLMHINVLGELVGGHAMTGGENVVEGKEPLVQGDARTLHDRTRADGVDLAALLALVVALGDIALAVLARAGDLCMVAPAVRADGLPVPTLFFDVKAGCLGIGETLEELEN